MTPYLSRESEIMALASAIRGASNPDEATDKARASGFSVEQIERHFDEAMNREFIRVAMALQHARAM